MFNSTVTNESFVQSIITEFRKEYHIESEVILEFLCLVISCLIKTFVDSNLGCYTWNTSIGVHSSRTERASGEFLYVNVRVPSIITPTFVKSWDWKYGQTPEFSDTLNRSFPWGSIVCPFLPVSHPHQLTYCRASPSRLIMESSPIVPFTVTSKIRNGPSNWKGF